jgi:predicted nucleotidyltransferase
MSTVSLDDDTTKAARAFISRLSGKYDVMGAILFGSRARQTHRPDSDADIAVLLHGHRGRFLDTKLALDAGTTRPDLDAAMQSHILAKSELLGRYGRE